MTQLQLGFFELKTICFICNNLTWLHHGGGVRAITKEGEMPLRSVGRMHDLCLRRPPTIVLTAESGPETMLGRAYVPRSQLHNDNCLKALAAVGTITDKKR